MHQVSSGDAPSWEAIREQSRWSSPGNPRGPSGERRRLWLLYAAAFKTRGIMMVAPVGVMLLVHRWEWTNTLGVWLTGLPLFLSGWALRVWSQRHLKYRLREERELATTGPYAWMRNPVYAGNMLILSGLCILCRLVWAAPAVWAWAVLVYALAIRFEEYRLRQRYGERYAAYCQVVPRWWPRRRSRGDAAPAAVVTWLRATAVEWQCLLLLALPVIKDLARR